MTSAEGWYRDPFGKHEGRWFSDGTPTALVRDGGSEAHDPPPDEPVTGPLLELGSNTPADGRDLLRADQAEQQSAEEGTTPGEEAMDASSRFGGID
jgi:hypothetical protein